MLRENPLSKNNIVTQLHHFTESKQIEYLTSKLKYT